jgi:hypothetical protein
VPKIPDATALGPRPTPDVLQPVLEQPGSLKARALQGLGKTLVGIGDQMYQSDAESQYNEARTALNDFEAKLHDPDTGIASKQGKDAFDLTKTAPAQFDEFTGKVINGMTNKRARELASDMALSRRSQIQATVGDYVARQREVYNDGQYKAGMESSMNRVSTRPDMLATELEFQRTATTGRLAKRGASPEETSAAIGNLHSAAYGAVVDGMIGRGQYQEARKFFDKNLSAFGDKSDEYGRRTNAAIEHDLLVKDRLRAEAERGVRVKASQAIEASDPTLPVDTVLKDMSVSISAQPGLREQLESRQKQRLQGLSVQSDPREVDRLRTLQGTDPQAFEKVDITKSYPKLSISDRDYFEKAQKEAGDPSKQAQVATEEAQLRKYGDLMKLPGGDKGDELRGLFRQAYDGEKAAAMKANGNKAPNFDEREAIFKRITLPFMREHWYKSNETIPAFRAKEGDTVPTADRDQIVEAFTARNKRAPTEQEVTYYYALKAGR